MKHAPTGEDRRRSVISATSRILGRPVVRRFRRRNLPADSAERVAIGMIARHGLNAAREATIRLNRMIDRGDLAARDLWACIVHMIHERRP